MAARLRPPALPHCIPAQGGHLPAHRLPQHRGAARPPQRHILLTAGRRGHQGLQQPQGSAPRSPRGLTCTGAEGTLLPGCSVAPRLCAPPAPCPALGAHGSAGISARATATAATGWGHLSATPHRDHSPISSRHETPMATQSSGTPRTPRTAKREGPSDVNSQLVLMPVRTLYMEKLQLSTFFLPPPPPPHDAVYITMPRGHRLPQRLRAAPPHPPTHRQRS